MKGQIKINPHLKDLFKRKDEREKPKMATVERR